MSLNDKISNLTRGKDVVVVEERARKNKKSQRKKSGDGTKKVLFDNGEQNEVVLSKKSENSLIVERRLSRRKKAKKPNRLLVFANKFGKTKIEVSGENAHKVLASLSSVAPLFCIEKKDGKTTFFVKSKQCDKIVAILRKLCYDYKIIEIIGAVPSTARTLVRVGIALGICVSVVGLGVYPSFITNVSVEGGNVSQVESVLKNYGIVKGAFAPHIDVGAVENDLLKLDGVAFASVKRSGAHISICVKEELPKDSLVGIKGKPIVSSKRATITRVVVRGGTAVVKYGDVVNVGDLIIEPYVAMGDDKIEVVPDGEAYGKVYYQKSVFFANEYVETTIGETKVVTKMSMFGKTPKTPKSPYDVYQLETSVQEFGFLLPFEIHRFEFRQLIAKKVQNTLDENAMKERVYTSILEEFTTPATVQNVYWETEKTLNGTQVKVTVEVEEKITV